MKQLLSDVKTLVDQEYNRAAEKFGAANNSPHESFAVILEEAEEAQEQAGFFSKEMERYWTSVKENKPTDSQLNEMLLCATLAAAEWIQVAAMCHKATIGKEK